MAHRVTIHRRDGRREQATVRTRPHPLLVLATGAIIARAANTLGIVVVEAAPELAGILRAEGYVVDCHE
jgi:hypothetical protein